MAGKVVSQQNRPKPSLDPIRQAATFAEQFQRDAPEMTIPMLGYHPDVSIHVFSCTLPPLL
jgi:hypothetical protein